MVSGGIVAFFPCILALTAAVTHDVSKPPGQPRLAVQFPSQLGAAGAAAFGQKYNAATDADKVTLNFGLKKQSDLTAGGQVGNAAVQGGGGAGMYGPGPYGPGPYGGNPYGGGGNPYGGNPYGPPNGMAGAGYGQAMYQPASSAAGMHDSLGIDFGITREKGQKNAQGQQQGVVVSAGR